MKVALTAAIMDMFHEGHVKLLENMRAEAEKVVVVLHTDESCFSIKRKFPVQSLAKRIQNLKSSGLVDDVLVTDWDDPGGQFVAATWMYPRADWVFMRGSDNVDFPGKATIEHLGIPIKILPYTEGVSSTQMRADL